MFYMKFHETHYEEYVQKVKTHNIHNELTPFYRNLPSNIEQFRNIMLHGPSGTGKYSQALHIIEKYSPSKLKYEKMMTVISEKGEVSYKISDIHFEVDLMLLGCHSKVIWHELFGQIVEVVSLKKEKMGIILCKNFHCIHSELLEIFYSYMQQYNHNNLAIQLRFILLTEHISFLPINIINHCYILPVMRPKKEHYKKMGLKMDIEEKNILNLKEIKSLKNVKDEEELQEDLFDKLHTQLLEIMVLEDTNYYTFRELLYDLLIYNVDVHEMVTTILFELVQTKQINSESLTKILNKLPNLLKQYNNNYRPIYHLENIFLSITNELSN